MSDIILTDGQQAAYEGFVSFIVNPAETVFVLKGYAGTGKSTLVKKLLTDLPATMKMAKLLVQDDIDWQIQLTATTNKAAEALADITNEEVRTIQSFLNLIVHKDHRTNKTQLVARGDAVIQQHFILFIDEASYIDSALLQHIFEWTDRCKICFIGDPAQLTPVKANTTPAFAAGFTTAELTQVVRQADGNPIIDLATGFRDWVNTGRFTPFTPDGNHIKHMGRAEFEGAILSEFGRDGWTYNDSKVLAWTNKTVIGYNQGIRQSVQGAPELEVGDYAICNKYISNKNCNIKTDQTVKITSISRYIEHGVEGWQVALDHRHTAFLPVSLEASKEAIKAARAREDWQTVKHIDSHWIDLRAAYACTINKSQGSTYDRVFIDLDDVGKCRNANQVARMLYVAVSRARHQVFLTGDLV